MLCLLFCFSLIYSHENNNNQQDLLSIPKLKSLAFVTYCKKNNPLNIPLKNQDITFDIIDCEHALKNVSVKEDNRLKMAENALLTIEIKSDNYFHQFLLNGSISSWWHSSKNSGNYLFLDDKVLLYVPKSSKLLSFVSKDTIFIYSKGYCSTAIIKMCRQHFTTTNFNLIKYSNTMLYEQGNLYIGGRDELHRLDPENPLTVLNEWKIEESCFIHFCKQLKGNYLFVKTKFGGSFIINLNTNETCKVFTKDLCKWINFSQSTNKAVIRDSCGTLYCYRINQGIFSDKKKLPITNATNFAFLLAQENLIAIDHIDDVSAGYSLYDIKKHHTIARIRTDNWVKDFYSTCDSLFSYCSYDHVLYNTNYHSLVNLWNYKKKFLNNHAIIIDKRKKSNSATMDLFGKDIFW